MVAHQCSLYLPSPLLDIQTHQTAIFKNRQFQNVSVWKCCFHFKFLLEIKKQEVALSISRHKGILNKHLYNNVCIFLWRFEHRRRRLNSNYYTIEENNDIFLACGGALVYLAELVNKNYFTTFVWGYPFSTYVTYN